MTTETQDATTPAAGPAAEAPAVQHPYIPLTDDDRAAMLATVGAASTADLFADIPAPHRLPALDLPDALSELELLQAMQALGANNRVATERACFLGAGAYRHFRPSIVEPLVMRGEFLTSYTPYQPEVSQGTLQTIFEFQSLVCALTGMDVANAGMYDGASALAEACLMACAVTGRRRIAVSDRVHPHWLDVVRGYARGRGIAVDALPHGEFTLTGEHACLAVAQPDFFGRVSADAGVWGEAAHAAGALFVVAADPVSLGLYRAPADYGADVVVAEGQALGVPLSYGGPYVGMFACRERFIRQMPGRIVGQTADLDGRRGYVLTLQTREQHIRRERATSNICTSQQLIALATAVHLAALGPRGLRRVAELCYEKAHYAAAALDALPGYAVERDEPFFHEFVVRTPRPPAEINRALMERGIIGGLDVSDLLRHRMLLCVTEMNTRAEIDALATALEELA
ncbi:MAG TPA: aminomethyl-transferring glycine dehydrogenase subunit GcvPA [Dehalococcoidia bacterium]|nr:aminomethyl-transferring glycine dehydrogenase subunit GcvPA [Dehalococcoidia bacterium]